MNEWRRRTHSRKKIVTFLIKLFLIELSFCVVTSGDLTMKMQFQNWRKPKNCSTENEIVKPKLVIVEFVQWNKMNKTEMKSNCSALNSSRLSKQGNESFSICFRSICRTHFHHQMAFNDVKSESEIENFCERKRKENKQRACVHLSTRSSERYLLSRDEKMAAAVRLVYFYFVFSFILFACCCSSTLKYLFGSKTYNLTSVSAVRNGAYRHLFDQQSLDDISVRSVTWVKWLFPANVEKCRKTQRNHREPTIFVDCWFHCLIRALTSIRSIVHSLLWEILFRSNELTTVERHDWRSLCLI